jgi:hypothetical protein
VADTEKPSGQDVKRSTASDRDFSYKTDAFVCLALVGAILVTAAALQLIAFGVTPNPIETPILALVYLVTASFVFGVLFTPLERFLPNHWAFIRYINRMMLEFKPPVIGWVVGFAMGLGYIAVMLAIVFAFSLALSIFWIAPTVVWLSIFHNVPVSDSASYALFLSQGDPRYDTPFGTTNDPSVIGFGIFNLLAWGAAALVLAVIVAPFWLLWGWYDHRK